MYLRIRNEISASDEISVTHNCTRYLLIYHLQLSGKICTVQNVKNLSLESVKLV